MTDLQMHSANIPHLAACLGSHNDRCLPVVRRMRKNTKGGEIAHPKRFTTTLESTYPPQNEPLAKDGCFSVLALGVHLLFGIYDLIPCGVNSNAEA